MNNLLNRIAKGDSSAVEGLLDRYGGLVWSIAKRYSQVAWEAEDAVQEIFLQLWQQAPKFDPQRSSEKNFVAMIARRRMIDRLRRGLNHPREASLDELASAAEPVVRDDRRIEEGTEAGLAARAMRGLPAAQRQALILSVYYGYTHMEIAQATKTPLGTVKSYITRGLKVVRDALSPPRIDGKALRR